MKKYYFPLLCAVVGAVMSLGLTACSELMTGILTGMQQGVSGSTNGYFSAYQNTQKSTNTPATKGTLTNSYYGVPGGLNIDKSSVNGIPGTMMTVSSDDSSSGSSTSSSSGSSTTQQARPKQCSACHGTGIHQLCNGTGFYQPGLKPEKVKCGCTGGKCTLCKGTGTFGVYR